MDTILLSSGFKLNTAGIYNDNAITCEDVKEIESLIDKAIMSAQYLCDTGMVKGHLSKDGEPEPVLFPQLPYVTDDGINTPNMIKQLKDLGEYAQEHINVVITFGIGGSYLGDKVIFDVHCGEFWNEAQADERQFYPKIVFAGYNVDGKRTKHIIDRVARDFKQQGKPFKALLMVVSKSGSTIEPMANFIVVRDAFDRLGIEYEVVAITDTNTKEKETLLHEIAVKEKWRIFSVPQGVGGRFSVFTEVGLVLGALVGFDIENFLAGAKDMDQVCRSKNLKDNPALWSAVLKFIAAEKYGRTIEVFMPYGGELKSLSEWYVQLLAESLGKTRKNLDLPYGRTPVVAVGTTDMHAQVQEHQEGRFNKVVQFVTVKEWETDVVVPHKYEEYSAIKAFTGVSLNEIMEIAYEANQEAQTGANRFNATIELPKMNAYYLGQIMFMLCWAIFYESQLAQVDAFDQPGVEVYKRLLGPKLKMIKDKKGIK